MYNQTIDALLKDAATRSEPYKSSETPLECRVLLRSGYQSHGLLARHHFPSSEPEQPVDWCYRLVVPAMISGEGNEPISAIAEHFFHASEVEAIIVMHREPKKPSIIMGRS